MLNKLWQRWQLRRHYPKLHTLCRDTVFGIELTGEKDGKAVSWTGTGFLLDGGIVCTAAHVVAGASTITVRSQSGESHTVARTRLTNQDIAFLHVPALAGVRGLRCLQMREVDGNAPVMLAGCAYDAGRKPDLFPRWNPLTFFNDPSFRVNAGDTSHLRQTTHLLFSHHVANKGDSGAPLLDADGNVVGMVISFAKWAMFTVGDSNRWLPTANLSLHAAAHDIAWQKDLLFGDNT